MRMKHAWAIAILLLLAACGERVRTSAASPEPAPCANSEATDESGAPAPAPAKEPAPHPDEGKPEPVPTGEGGFQADKKATGFPSGYSRELKVLYIEQRFRWQARVLNEALKRDKGLRYQGFFFDALDGWTQPTSQWSDEVKREVRPLQWPFFANGTVVREKKDFLDIGYDVVILGDIDPASKFWRAEYWDWLDSFVDAGGGLILMAGQGNNPSMYVNNETARKLYPVNLDLPDGYENMVNRKKLKYYGLTEEGREHELFHLSDDEGRNAELWGGESDDKYVPGELHGLYWYHATGGAAEGATVLARVVKSGEAINDGEILAATKSHGEGRVLWMGTDDTWLWRQWVGDHYFYKFWQNAMRWVAADPGKQDD